jgi:benzodiazapine receptor
MMGKVFRLIIFVLGCEAAGFIGSFATTPAIPTWYAGLVKPAFNPPNWIFAPVWSLLYLLMGVALWLVWEKRGWGAPVVGFIIQLALNIAWSFIFFGMHLPLWAFAEIIVLWLLILICTVQFWRRAPVAGILMLPYLGWVSFAAVLNYALYSLNPA